MQGAQGVQQLAPTVENQEEAPAVQDTAAQPVPGASAADQVGQQALDSGEKEQDIKQLQEAMQLSDQELLQKEQQDVQQAIFNSRFQPHDGVVLRITGNHEEARTAMQNANDLRDARDRVTGTGCDLLPEWGCGAFFLLPFREEEDFKRLDFSLQGDLKDYHIVCFESDVETVKGALRQIPNRRRPQCKHAGEPLAASSSSSPGQSFLDMTSIKVEIEKTFYTFKQEGASSSTTSKCRTAPY